MNILTIDTSASLQLITIRKNSDDFNYSWDAGMTHTVSLMTKIDESLKDCGLLPEEIDLFGAGMGPGSFTGIRITATTVRMFAQILSKPVAQAETHRLYAEGSGIKNGSLVVSFDAKKGKVFGALYTFNEGTLTEIISPHDCTIESLIAAHDRKHQLSFIGDGYTRYQDNIRHCAPDHVFIENFIPDAKSINTFIEGVYRQNPEECLDYNKVIPLYRRISDAEAAKQA